MQQALFEQQPLHPDRLGLTVIQDRPKAKVLHKGSGMLADFDYTLNPYIGCAFGCSYCYAAAFVADETKRLDWGKWVDVKSSAVEEIKRADLLGKKVFMSSATDPYQPIEAHVELTRQMLEVMSHPFRQPKLLVQTRGPLVTRDIDLLKAFEYLQVNLSITTDSDDVRKQFEPSCASIERRLEAARKLSAEGIRVQICLSPMLPIVDPEKFAKALRDTGARKFVMNGFHLSDRQFASSTRDSGLEVAERLGWSHREYRATALLMKEYLPEINARWED